MPVRVIDVGDVAWMAPKEGQSGELFEVLDEEECSKARFLHPGGESELYLHEARTPPDTEILPHVHRTDEIIYVTEGEMHLGARVLRPGSSVYIPANTLYGFKAGPQGLTFLNFRAVRDTSHVMKDEFLAERAAARDGA